jgi:hypothetical protein
MGNHSSKRMTMNDPTNESGWIGRPRAIAMTDEASRAGFVETATVLSEECELVVDFLGRHSTDRRSTLMLEASGRYLAYRLVSDGAGYSCAAASWIRLAGKKSWSQATRRKVERQCEGRLSPSRAAKRAT